MSDYYDRIQEQNRASYESQKSIATEYYNSKQPSSKSSSSSSGILPGSSSSNYTYEETKFDRFAAKLMKHLLLFALSLFITSGIFAGIVEICSQAFKLAHIIVPTNIKLIATFVLVTPVQIYILIKWKQFYKILIITFIGLSVLAALFVIGYFIFKH